MATTSSESANRYGRLRLADRDPEVEPGSGSRFNVKFAFEGTNLIEMQTALGPRLAAVGVARVTRSGMTITLYGVEQGREGDVFGAVQSALDDVNEARRVAQGDAEERRAASDAASAAADVRLEEVREGFHEARQSRIAHETGVTLGAEARQNGNRATPRRA
jgi:hypothetical protein